MHRLITLLGLFAPILAFGTVLLTQEQALKQMFPDADEVKPVSLLLAVDQVARVKGTARDTSHISARCQGATRLRREVPGARFQFPVEDVG